MPPNSSRRVGSASPPSKRPGAAPPAADAPESAPAPTALRPGDEVADVRVTELVAASGGAEVWRGTRADGSEVTLHSLPPGASNAARDHFLAAAGDLSRALQAARLPGVAPVVEVDPVAGAYVGAAVPLGTMLDLPVLKWDTEQQLEFMRRMCRSIQALHDAGLAHGCLRPENVLLDAQLRPLLINVGTIDVASACADSEAVKEDHRRYAAPEVVAGHKPDRHSDIFSLGRLLFFVLAGEMVAQPDEEIPRLDALRSAPPGLVRIVRRCTVRTPDHRYPNVTALLADLERFGKNERAGLDHPDVDDLARFTEAAGAASGRPVSLTPRTSLKPKTPPEASREASLPPGKRKGQQRGASWLSWTRRRAVTWMALGVGMLAAAALATRLAGTLADLWRTLALMGSVLVGLAVPGFGKSPGLARLLLVCVCLAVVVHVDPIGLVAGNGSSRASGLQAASVSERVATLRSLRGAGETVFTRVDLGGAELSGLDLRKLTLDGSSLRGARCVGTQLSHASLINVDLTGADLSAAKLEGLNPDFIVGWTTAKCDTKTVMPRGWSCPDGRPVVGKSSR